jgi:hypothetical protein
MVDIVNEAFCAVPCASCGDYRRDFVLARLVMFWLKSFSGQNPAVPTREELFKGCCKSSQPDSITFLVPEAVGRPEPKPYPGTWWK